MALGARVVHTSNWSPTWDHEENYENLLWLAGLGWQIPLDPERRHRLALGAMLGTDDEPDDFTREVIPVYSYYYYPYVSYVNMDEPIRPEILRAGVQILYTMDDRVSAGLVLDYKHRRTNWTLDYESISDYGTYQSVHRHIDEYTENDQLIGVSPILRLVLPAGGDTRFRLGLRYSSWGSGGFAYESTSTYESYLLYDDGTITNYYSSLNTYSSTSELYRHRLGLGLGFEAPVQGLRFGLQAESRAVDQPPFSQDSMIDIGVGMEAAFSPYVAWRIGADLFPSAKSNAFSTGLGILAGAVRLDLLGAAYIMHNEVIGFQAAAAVTVGL